MAVFGGMLRSKKFMASFLGCLTVLGVQLGLPREVAHELAPLLAGIVSAYVLGQGASDWGKEAARIEAERQ